MKYIPKPGEWHYRGDGGWVYSDVPDGITIPGAADPYYGGFLVCESVGPALGPLIAEAPLLLDLARRFRDRLLMLGSLLATPAYEPERKSLAEIEAMLVRIGVTP